MKSNLSPERLEYLKKLYSGKRVINPPTRIEGRCRLCDSIVKPKSGRTAWCSETCFNEWEMWQNPKLAAWEKDKGVCQECRLDAGELEKELKSIADHRTPLGMDKIQIEAKKLGFNAETCLWEADHIHEVHEGGSNWPGNIRTLCQKCHKKATARFRKRKAESDKKTIKVSKYGSLRTGDEVRVMSKSMYDDGWYWDVGRVVKIMPTIIKVKWKNRKGKFVRASFRRTDGKCSGKPWSHIKTMDESI